MSLSSLERVTNRSRSGSFSAWLVFVCLSVVWISLNPFKDLSPLNLLEDDTGREFWTYVVFTALAGACLGLVAKSNSAPFRALAIPANLVLVAWIGVSVVTSTDVATSLKRVCLPAFSASIAASLFLLPRDRDEFARSLFLAVVLVIGLSYFGVLAMPNVAIHQATDVFEPNLDGDWRGVFEHKNGAAGVFSVFVFIGIYVGRTGGAGLGAAITALSAIFLVNSGGKSSLGLCVLTVVVGLVADQWVRSLWAQAAVLMAPQALMLTLSVGSILSPTIQASLDVLPVDPTFTGRTDIWRFAIEKIWETPILGHGFAAFWSSDASRFGADGANAWAGGAAHAHNSFVDTALNMGLPGLLAALWAFVLQPLRDYHVVAQSSRDPQTRALMLMLWIFGLYLSTFETIMFQRNDPVWITFLFGVCSLRYMAFYEQRARSRWAPQADCWRRMNADSRLGPGRS